MISRLSGIFFIYTLLFFLVLPSSIALASPPEGQLYWITNEYPTHYFLHTNDEGTHNGALAALNYACTQNAGYGTYTGDIYFDDSATNLPAMKEGSCINQHPLIPGETIIGNDYFAYLYCNGVKRADGDDSVCNPPVIPPERNFDGACEDGN